MMEKQLMQPIVGAHKVAFQTWFQSVSAMQDQTMKVMDNLWSQVPIVPEKNRKMFTEWTDTLQKGRAEMKKVIDQGFDTWEQVLFGPEKTQDTKAEGTKSSPSKAASA
ncbi:MAG: hypothetical protein KGY41_08420 [Desulfovermiculus sp.]|nr:hypothetical protein [Desulfovermiculus sp.]